MKIQNGQNKILFSCGKLYLNGAQIAGEGIEPQKDVLFDFTVNIPEEKVEINTDPVKDSSVLEVNVFDAIKSQAVGPGQM